MKTSNPVSYDKIFATTANTAISPDHRALLLSNEFDGEVVFTNLNGIVSSITFAPGNHFLPLRIKQWNSSGSVFYVYGLQ